MSRPGRYPVPHTPHRQARDARKRKRQKGRGSGADSHHIASHGNPKPPPLSGRKSPPWMAQEGQGGLQPGRILLHYGGASKPGLSSSGIGHELSGAAAPPLRASWAACRARVAPTPRSSSSSSPSAVAGCSLGARRSPHPLSPLVAPQSFRTVVAERRDQCTVEKDWRANFGVTRCGAPASRP